MAVNLKPPRNEDLHPVAGVELGFAEAGIRKANRRDLMLMRFAPGTRIAGGWELIGLSLPASGHIRARARIIGGYSNGSSGLVETIAALRERIQGAAVELSWIPALQKDTRTRNVHASTAIEGNPLTLEEVRAAGGWIDWRDNQRPPFSPISVPRPCGSWRMNLPKKASK